jgi:hypothetical protein
VSHARQLAPALRRRLACPLTDGDRGSTVLELVVLAPGLLLFIGLVVFAGRMSLAKQSIAQAADEASRTASIARTQPEADRTACSASPRPSASTPPASPGPQEPRRRSPRRSAASSCWPTWPCQDCPGAEQ